MHRILRTAAVLLMLAAAVGAAYGQQRVVMHGSAKGGFTLLLPGMLIIFSTDEEASELRVARRMQFREELSEEYRGLDLEEGDVIMIADGQPLASSDDFKKLYEKAEVGTEITLGVRREDEVMVMSFPKPDPSSLPKMRMQMGGGEGDEHGFQTKGDVMIRKESPKKEKKKEQKPPPDGDRRPETGIRQKVPGTIS